MLLIECLFPSANPRIPGGERSRRSPSGLLSRGLLYPALALSMLLGVLGVSPLAHASTPVISPELSVSPDASRTTEPAVAAGNGVYLVVWTQKWQLGVALLGVRVRASDGAVLDAQPLPLATSTYFNAARPAVAFDGNAFLVVFSGMTRGGEGIYGRRVRASDGVLLDSYLLGLNQSPYSTNPSVAFDGTNYVVAWWGYNGAGPDYYVVYGNFVRPSDGRRVLSNDLIIGAAARKTAPRVAAGNGRLLVAWDQNNDVVGARVDAASKTLIDSTPLALAVSAEGESGPAVASSGSQFLVVWHGASGQVKGTRVRGSDGAVLDGAGFPMGPARAAPSVSFDGQDYRVAWQGTSAGTRALLSARVSPQGAATAPLFLSPVHASTTTSDASIAAAGAGHFLVAYPQYDAQQGWDRIKARRVQDVASCAEATPTLVINGGAELTLECSSGATYSDAGAQAFDGCGNPLSVFAYNTGADSSGPGPLLRYEGSYTVSYSAWDAEGRTVSASRTVHVDDRTAPALRLLGPAHLTHSCGSEWVDPGVEATDACYGNLAQQVLHTGQVNGWAEGTYTVTYSLTDSGGNSATPVTRTVEVINCPW